MLICVKFDCKWLVMRKLQIRKKVDLSRYFIVKISKFDCRRKEFIFIYKR